MSLTFDRMREILRASKVTAKRLWFQPWDCEGYQPIAGAIGTRHGIPGCFEMGQIGILDDQVGLCITTDKVPRGFVALVADTDGPEDLQPGWVPREDQLVRIES